MAIRMPVFSHSHRLALIGALLLAAASRAPAESPDAFRADCLALTAAAHRLTGSPEYRRAADYVERRLRASGMDEVLVEEFPAIRAVVKRCDMTLENSRRLDLLPMRANGLMLPVTPAEGITGPIQYAGMGRLEDYGRRPPAGAIVVLDYNAGAAWLDAFRMGAKAVVFVRNGPMTSPRRPFDREPRQLSAVLLSGSGERPARRRAGHPSQRNRLGKRHRPQRLRFPQRNRADVRPGERGMPDPGGEPRQLRRGPRAFARGARRGQCRRLDPVGGVPEGASPAPARAPGLLRRPGPGARRKPGVLPGARADRTTKPGS